MNLNSYFEPVKILQLYYFFNLRNLRIIFNLWIALLELSALSSV